MSSPRDVILEQLIREEWPRLRRFFRTKVPDGDVLDLVQSTMLAYVQGAPRSDATARAYLWGIARFQVLKYYEKHRRKSDVFDSAIHTAHDLGPSLSSKLDNRNRLMAALHSLPVDQQMAVELRHGEELQLQEVADAIGVSLATVKRYLSAAEEKLRTVLGSDSDSVRDAYTKL